METPGQDDRPDDNSLFVDFCGIEHVVGQADQLTFGRKADLIIDDNPHLHRVLGRFTYRGGMWWVVNEGRHFALEVVDIESRSSASVAPGSSTAISFAASRIRFEAGRTRYELLVDQPVLLDSSLRISNRPDAPEPVELGDETITAFDVPMTDDQFLLVLAVAEPLLLAPSASTAMPTSRALAGRLGWSQSKFERKLDNVCQKFAKTGVRGLHGGQGSIVKDRKTRLAEYAIETSLVKVSDLDKLNA